MPSCFRVFHFFFTGRHLGLAAAIENEGFARAQAQRRADGIERGVAAADHGDVLAAEIEHGLVVLGELVGVHQVDAGQEFVGRIDAIEVFAGNAHELRKPGAGADKDRVVAFFIA